MKRSGFSHVSVKDYQSIAEADVPLGPLTIIVGDNDAGKSALLRAIRAACFNETGTGNIRHDADKMRVELVLDTDGVPEYKLLWRKKREGGATYDLWPLDADGEATDHESFSKLGSAVPPKVRDALNIASIEVDKTFTIQPQVHQQGEFAFLLDRSEGQAARALAKMTKLDVVVEAQGLIRSDLKSARGALKATTTLLEDLDRQVKEYEGLDDEVKLLENVSDFIGLAESEQRRIADMRIALTKYINARKALEEVPDLPDVDSLLGPFEDLARSRRLLDDWQIATNQIGAAGTVPDIQPLVAQFHEVQRARNAWGLAVIAQNRLGDVHDEMRENDEQYMSLVADWNDTAVCSACGQPLPRMVAT